MTYTLLHAMKFLKNIINLLTTYFMDLNFESFITKTTIPSIKSIDSHNFFPIVQL